MTTPFQFGLVGRGQAEAGAPRSLEAGAVNWRRGQVTRSPDYGRHSGTDSFLLTFILFMINMPSLEVRIPGSLTFDFVSI
jgi:hypothetical protein